MFDEVPPVGAVDAAWMTAVLEHAGLADGATVVSVRATPIGTGQVGANVRFELDWDRADPGLPASVVGKFPSDDEMSRATAATVGTYVREVGFYRHLANAVSVPTPRVHHIGWNADTSDFVLLMDDAAPAEPGDQLAGCDVEQAHLAIDALVGFHASTWGDVDRWRHHDWLGYPDEARTAAFAEIMVWALDGFRERFADRLDGDVLALAADAVAGYTAWWSQMRRWAAAHGGFCLVHGDYRPDNLLFGVGAGARPITVVDWQTVGIGIGPLDVAYFCGGGLLPDERVATERELVGRYAAGLRCSGVDLDDESAWEGYALTARSGLFMAIVASQVVAQTERGDEMFAVMAERHAHQMHTTALA